MYSVETFSIWLDALEEANIDTDEIFDKELTRGRLFDMDWTRETFQRLIDWEYQYQAPDVMSRCRFCAQWRNQSDLVIQPIWVFALEEIKGGKDPNDTIWGVQTRLESSRHLSYSSQELEGNNGGKSQARHLNGSTRNVEVGHSEWDKAIIASLHKKFCTSKVHDFTVPEKHPRPKVDAEEECSAMTGHIDRDAWSSLEREDTMCIGCWLKFLNIRPGETGCKPNRASCDSKSDTSDADMDTDTNTDVETETDAFSEDDFSPFLVHS